MSEERVTYTTQLESRIAELEAGFNAARRVVEMQLQTIARLEADNRRLRHLDAMPVDAMRRYYRGTVYDTRTNVVGYGPENYDEDEAAIGAWFASLDGAA